MSSIAGFTIHHQDCKLRTKMDLMLNTMSFRSGSEKVFFQDNKVMLGSSHEKTGTGYNRGGDIVALLDGEIFNIKELVNYLSQEEAYSDDFCAVSLLPSLYEKFGLDFLVKINGNFIIVIYDKKEDRILMARDHMGAKNLFYYFDGSILVFASTIAAIISSKLVPLSIRRKSLNLYFANTTVPHPYTMFCKICSVPPSTVVEIRNGVRREIIYWDCGQQRELPGRSEEDFVEQIRAVCIDAIKIRGGDQSKKVGCVLSGGVDSSLITAVVSKECERHSTLPTFSIKFAENKYDDSHLQKVMIERFPIKNYQIIFKDKDAIDALLEVVKLLDNPLNNASVLGTFLCFKKARDKGIEVILEGEAADELFCGGGGAVGEHLIQLFERVPFTFRRIFKLFGDSLYSGEPGRFKAFQRLCYRLCMTSSTRMLSWLPVFDRNSRKKLFAPELQKYVDTLDEYETGQRWLHSANLTDPLNRYLYAVCRTYLCDDLLFKNERMASGNGLYNRTPFIDYRLVELAFRIPSKYKIKGYSQSRAEKKYIFRKALSGIVPDEILWRRKLRGFSQPVEIWFRGPLKDFLFDTLTSKNARERGIWKTSFVEQIIQMHMNGANMTRYIFAFLMLELWLKEVESYKGLH